MANWWEAGGASGAVAVYQPIGAASLAASYSNLCNPGTYDAAPGTAPTFNAATGWTFNGTTQHLVTGVVAAAGWSAVVRYANAAGGAAQLLMGAGNATDRALIVGPRYTGDGRTNELIMGNGNLYYATSGAGSGQASGVVAITGESVLYHDGAAVPMTFWAARNYETTNDLYIGAVNYAGAFGTASHYGGDIQAVAIYNNTLDAAEVAAVSAAMAALPVSAVVASVVAQMTHHHAVFGG